MGTGSAGGTPNTPNLEDLLRLGISSAKAGRRENARVIFRQVIEQDRRNERAWLWLASVEDNPLERRRILQTVLEINPNNANARKLLTAMDKAVSDSERRSITLGIRILIGVLALIALAILILVIIT
jgi:tetratricopeptide (TPR) repeat protein